jgi:hypothetical protein
VLCLRIDPVPKPRVSLPISPPRARIWLRYSFQSSIAIVSSKVVAAFIKLVGLGRRNALRCIVVKAVHAQRPLQPDDRAFHRLQQSSDISTVSGK